MRIVGIDVIHAQTRMKRAFRHASHTRDRNDGILVRCELDSGHVGWGEGLPREYVTGETIETAWNQLSKTFATDGSGARLNDADFETLTDAVNTLDGWRLTGSESGERDCFGNAARCAVELALLDAVGRATDTPLHTLGKVIAECAEVAATNDRVRYGVVVSPTTVRKALKWGLIARLYRFPDVKVKLGVDGVDERKVLNRLEAVIGSKCPLRADINEAWPVDQIADRIATLGPVGQRIETIEQPCRHENIAALAALKGKIPPVVLDESLCAMDDAEAAVQHGYGEVFNLRVSKCGGLIPSFQLAAYASKNGREYQIGCQVGESGILSAAGRSLACGLKNVRRLEGSYDRHLVSEPLTAEDLTFGFGGRAKRLEGGGLGITVDEQAVARVTIRRQKFRN